MIFSKKQVILYILSLVTLIVTSYFFIDETIAKYFLANMKTYKALGDFISIFGESHWYFATAIIGFIIFKFVKKNKLFEERFLFLLYINLFSGVMSLVIKNIFGRIRPWGNDGDASGFLLFKNFDMSFFEKMKYQFITILDAPTTCTSFPSGHTTTVFAVFTYLVILFPKYFYLWLSMAIVLVFGRILDNGHFLSDIFAGVLVGTLSTLFIYSKMREKIEKNS